MRQRENGGTKMVKTWRNTAAALIVSCSMLVTAVPVWADEAPVAASATVWDTYYQLTDALQVQVKSLLNERTTDGTRIGAVIQLKNNGTKINRVPEYELRVKTDQGVEYKLLPSAGSARAVQPQSKVEISYMVTIDRQDEVKLTELNWVEVDEYVYPKKETPKLNVDIEGQVWKGNNAAVTDQTALKKWGDSFRITSSNSPVVFTPVSLDRDNSGAAPAYIVKLLAENPSAYREKVPMFLLQGRSESEQYVGKRAEADEITLESKEKKYIHYRINVDQGAVLTSVDVLTPESYVSLGLDGTPVVTTYTVGRYNLLLPSGGIDNRYVEEYKLNTPITFDPISKLKNPNTDVSLVEFGIHDNQGAGYQTAVAKFLLTNHSSESTATPVFQSEIATQDGYTYSGYRQTNAASQLMPGMSHVVTYSYHLPDSETGENLKLKLLEAKAGNPITGEVGYKSTVATLKVAAQEAATKNSDVLSFYPYDVKVNWWVSQYFTNTQPTISYGYRVKMDLDIIQREKVVVDQDFSLFEIALVDSRDRIIGSAALSFVGTNNGMGKLTSGLLDLTMPNLRVDQYQDNMKLHIYETFQTPNGLARRLVAELK
jgi:hypothetical protein